MTPREAEIEADARIALQALREGQVDDQHLASALHALGNARLVEAQTDVERYLTHLAPHIQHMALHVLAFHLIDQTHDQTAVAFLLHDLEPFHCSLLGEAAAFFVQLNSKIQIELSYRLIWLLLKRIIALSNLRSMPHLF